ncbi:hypothetical protein L3Q82_003156 [Scortum barcoo]|uniref:Uncharacterized protein n=1 Tax=Scortum barcoo TaxID=214431 RepID=A0ACB8VRB9_9TELE|nr:hypothetical protein L3Q82_003156 [Scortum barcoo]
MTSNAPVCSCNKFGFAVSLGNSETDVTIPVVVAVVVLALVLIGVIGFVIYKKKNDVAHSLKYFYIASSGVQNFPEFVAVGLVDEVQMFHYDSNTRRAEPKQDWMRRVTEDDLQYWERETANCMSSQQIFKGNIQTAKMRFNQTGGVHVFQKVYGCEWDDETNEALLTKHKWDNDKAKTAQQKNYLTQICPEWLKKYVDFGRSSLLRTDLPSVSLLQKSPSSPVSCHATGFYPDRATLIWRKDGEELHEDVDHGEILPNHDGSFQMSVDLKLSSVTPEDWSRYDCVFHLSGVKDDIVTKLDKAEIRTNWEKRGSDGAQRSIQGHPPPHIGASDHLTIMLMPAYRQRVKVIKPVLKEVRVWPQEATSALQDCFGTTDWEMFKEAATYNNLIDVEEYTDTVTSYITKCIDDVTHIKSITTRANRKPWLTGDVHRLLKARDKAFKAGDESALRTARANLSRGIRKAKQDYTNKITSHFKDSKNATEPMAGHSGHYRTTNLHHGAKTPPPSHDQPLCLSAVSVKRTLSAINTRKAAGPDNIPGSVLKDCAEELKDVFTDIFNTSLRQAIVPSGFKAATIIPVPKKSSPSCFNDYRPVALTPIIMKCFERLLSVQHHNTTTTYLQTGQTGPQHLPLQLAAGFPQPKDLKRCVLATTSLSSITLSTGAPQGCVLSPLLFTLLTHDCTPTHSSNHLVKFADDTTLVGLITKGDETHYRKEVQLLTRWCKDNNLLLNVSKTKEIVVSFQRGHTQHHPLTIDGAAVERVSSTKFLGVHISDDLSWTTNTASLAKKAQQRLYFLRKLKRASAPPPIMTTFYRGTIESILTSLHHCLGRELHCPQQKSSTTHRNSETDLTIPVVVAVVVLALVLFAVIGFVIYKKKNESLTSERSAVSQSSTTGLLEKRVTA